VSRQSEQSAPSETVIGQLLASLLMIADGHGADAKHCKLYGTAL
jgi:hypothetical protein